MKPHWTIEATIKGEINKFAIISQEFGQCAHLTCGCRPVNKIISRIDMIRELQEAALGLVKHDGHAVGLWSGRGKDRKYLMLEELVP